MQMASQRLLRRLFIVFKFVVSLMLLTMFFILITSDGSWNVTRSSLFWSSFFAVDKLSSSMFVLQPDDTQLVVQGPPGVAAEIWPRCPGWVNTDDADRDICRPLLTGDANSSNTRPRWTNITAEEYAQRTDSCDCFRSDLGYFVSPEDTTDNERQFPIAFSLLTYENLEQTERLLRLIYRPHNVYCIHVDAKAPAEMHEGMEAIASCFDNVFIVKPPISIIWGNVSIVHAEILCMRQLLDIHKDWKYFINLVGRDFPLRTNYELVKILQAYDGANDVDATRNEER